jgi:hypothetical protein
MRADRSESDPGDPASPSRPDGDQVGVAIADCIEQRDLSVTAHDITVTLEPGSSESLERRAHVAIGIVALLGEHLLGFIRRNRGKPL